MVEHIQLTTRSPQRHLQFQASLEARQRKSADRLHRLLRQCSCVSWYGKERRDLTPSCTELAFGEPVKSTLAVTNTVRLQPMKNPWSALPEKSPYVLASDAALIEAFNARSTERHKFDISLLPEPFFGSLAASVVVLNLNPGWSPDDAAVHAKPEFCRMSRLSLQHQLLPYPFLHLQPDGDTPGSRWWRHRTRELAEDVGFQAVARGLACVQYAPYHSKEYTQSSPLLPSQEYGFALVRQAMARNAEIVVMRSHSLWVGAIPELATYGHVHRGSNPRAPFLSRGNLKSSYAPISRRLRSDA